MGRWAAERNGRVLRSVDGLGFLHIAVSGEMSASGKGVAAKFTTLHATAHHIAASHILAQPMMQSCTVDSE
eukprot:4001569-Amphidinium_carterae.2